MRMSVISFLVYLLLWSYLVGGALMSACGAAAHALVPLVDPDTDKVIYAVAHSLAGVVLVHLGGYRLFEKVMSVCIAVMFVTVITTASYVLATTVGADGADPLWKQAAAGLVRPTIPDFYGEGVGWTIALMGGVGGTLTIICYGYWIREEGREGTDQLTTCRIDLATGYTMTALFGIALVILGSQTVLDPEWRGTTVILNLGQQLETSLGPFGTVGRWAFLVGAWGAIASSLLGVWQAVPYLFTDFWNMTRHGVDKARQHAIDTQSVPYRAYLLGLATVPMLGLWIDFQEVQKANAVFGAFVMPMLALALLILNGRTQWVGRFRNSWPTAVVLVATLVFFAVFGWFVVVHGLPD
jgi:Mn2+/Fe2+ NRAMP family transporter